MRVLYLTDSLSDLDGVGRYTLRLVSALEALLPELEVEVLLARKHRPTSESTPAHWKVKVQLPPDYYFYMSRARFWGNTLRCLPGLAAAARRADVVHAIKDYPHNWLALQAARLAGKPCVATAHGTYTLQPLLDDRHRGRAAATYAGLDHMISVSNYTRGRLLETLAATGGGQDHQHPQRRGCRALPGPPRTGGAALAWQTLLPGPGRSQATQRAPSGPGSLVSRGP